MKDDTISRQGVLRLLNVVPSEEFATKAMLINGVNALPSAQPGWIPCSVALPEKEGVYLVTDSTAYGAKISLRYWNRHTAESFWSGYESDVVTAWMPLPTPYREGGCNA